VRSLNNLNIRIYADGADLGSIARLAADPRIKGFTTNPTLMRKSGVEDYAGFAAAVLKLVPDRPVSFEVFADDFGEMETQAREIASWGPLVDVKIPVTNTKGDSAAPLVRRLSAAGVRVNVTAMLTLDQVRAVAEALHPETVATVSLFAGRIADTGRDPTPLMREAVSILAARPRAQLLWASPREVLNVAQADEVGCHIITLTEGLLAKLGTLGKDLAEFSLDTVRMFHRDAEAAGYVLATRTAEVAE
jgi:transaldolase